MSAEYRVVWKRENLRVKRKRYVSRKFAERFLALLTDLEPWKRLGENPDALACCSGYECGCGGVTVRQGHESRLAEMPPLEWAHIEQREVGSWEGTTAGERTL